MSGARRFFWCVLRLGFAYPKKYKLEKERNTMNKVEDFINATKLNDLLNKKEDLINMTKLNELLNKKEAEERKTSKVVWIFAIIGIIAAVAAAVRSRPRRTLPRRRFQSAPASPSDWRRGRKAGRASRRGRGPSRPSCECSSEAGACPPHRCRGRSRPR